MPRKKSATGQPVGGKSPPQPAVLRGLGAQLRHLRLERQLSQERLAERAGLHYKYIGRVELGKADPGACVLVRLAEALGVSVGDLFRLPAGRATAVAPGPPAADADAVRTALSTLSAAVDRLLSESPRPVPTRAPRRPRS